MKQQLADLVENAGLAQLVEQRFCKAKVAGSSPAAGTSPYFVRVVVPSGVVTE